MVWNTRNKDQNIKLGNGANTRLRTQKYASGPYRVHCKPLYVGATTRKEGWREDCYRIIGLYVLEYRIIGL